MQVIRNPDAYKGAMGEQLGSSIGNTLNSLAQYKMRAIEDRYKKAQQLKEFTEAGRSPQEAAMLNLFRANPKVLQEVMQYQDYQRGLQPQGEQQQGTMSKQLQQEQMPSQTPNELFGQFQNQQPQFNPMQSLMQSLSGGMQQSPQEVQEQPKFNVPQQNKTVSNKPILAATKTVGNETLRAPTNKYDLPAYKAALGEQKEAQKESKVFMKKQLTDERGAKEDDRRLGRLEELTLKGDLTRPRWHAFYDALEHGVFGLGIDLHSLETADSQEFNKISKEFLKGAKNLFGSRITDNDVKVYLKMVPDLTQSREGKLKIINNMRLGNKALHLRTEAMKQIIRENGNRVPGNLELLVEDKIGPQLDTLAETFKKGSNIQEEKPSKFFPNPLDILLGKG